MAPIIRFCASGQDNFIVMVDETGFDFVFFIFRFIFVVDFCFFFEESAESMSSALSRATLFALISIGLKGN